jgi:hypothetical protein
MPFTFAHPSVVLPIKKKWNRYFNLTALVLGSMSPDFEYFMKLKIENKIGHSLLGFVTFNLPFVIVLAFIFHYVIKNTLILHLPIKAAEFIKHEVIQNPSHKGGNVLWVIIFIYSAILGMFSHTLWDSFTHENGYFVSMIPALHTKILIFPIYKLLQHGSTIVGLSIILIFLYNQRSNEHSNKKTMPYNRKVLYWASIFVGTIAFVFVRSINLNQYFTVKSIGTLIVSSISGLFLSITFVSVIFYKKISVVDLKN